MTSIRRVSFVMAVAVCCTVFTAAQTPSQKRSDQLQVLVQLDKLNGRINQDSKDLLDMARPRTQTCELYHAIVELSAQGSVAFSLIVGTEEILDMHTLVSGVSQRRLADQLLASHMAASRRGLENSISAIGNELGGSADLPAGAAVLGTRIRDDIRSALDLLDKAIPR